MPAGEVVRVVEREAQVFRRLWRGSVFSSVLTPVLFLGAIGIGLGGLVDEASSDVAGLSYLVFVTPGLLAAGAMQSAAGESLWPVMAGHKWMRTYHAMVASPIRALDVYVGELAWTAVRTTIGAVAFLAVAAALGGVPSWWGLLAVPAAVLCACAFAAPLSAFAATQQTDVSFSVIMRLGIVPLFLFSGTFFPVTQLPAGLQPLAVASPLWHGVELCRMATTGTLSGARAVGHVAVLVAVVAAATWWGVRTFRRRLAE
ncbi:MAG TPA: ABC transporter permease [Acidimicrobiales bacterium]|nr:ABC transporter permease [Acidimicrobiales bacterium]